MSVMPFVIPTIYLFTVECTAESSTGHQSKLWPHLIVPDGFYEKFTIYCKMGHWQVKFLYMIKFIAFAAAKLYLKNKLL